MQDIRCKNCNKKLGEINIEYIRDSALKAGANRELVDNYVNDIQEEIVNIKCPRCGEMNVRKENVEDEKSRKEDIKTVKAKR